MVQERAMLFVDAQNLVLGAKHYEKEGLDYDIDKLVETLTEDCNLIRGYWFDSHEPGNRDAKDDFYAFLQTTGFRVESTELSRDEDRFKEKEADIRLATELLSHGYNDSYDRAILVTGDRDFQRAIRQVQDLGKTVTVAAFKESMAEKLRRTADQCVHLDDHADVIELS